MAVATGPSCVDEIRQRYTDLIAFVVGDLNAAPVKKAGKGYMFNCWAHSDSSPSLFVTQNDFYCYSAQCHHGGDLFDYVGWRHDLDPHDKEDFKRILSILDNDAYTPPI